MRELFLAVVLGEEVMKVDGEKMKEATESSAYPVLNWVPFATGCVSAVTAFQEKVAAPCLSFLFLTGLPTPYLAAEGLRIHSLEVDLLDG